MTYVLGIDGGGTKTVCLVMNDRAQIISRGEAGASNYHTVGEKTAFTSIQAAILNAIAPLNSPTIGAIGIGLAGSI